MRWTGKAPRGLTSAGCVHIPFNEPVPFRQPFKRLGCCEFGVYTDCPWGDGPPVLRKGYVLSLQGRWSAVWGLQSTSCCCLCVCVRGRPIRGLDRQKSENKRQYIWRYNMPNPLEMQSICFWADYWKNTEKKWTNREVLNRFMTDAYTLLPSNIDPHWAHGNRHNRLNVQKPEEAEDLGNVIHLKITFK